MNGYEALWDNNAPTGYFFIDEYGDTQYGMYGDYTTTKLETVNQ